MAADGHPDVATLRDLPFVIHNRQGERIDAAWHVATGSGVPHTVAVIGHGVTSHKDRPWQEALGDALADHGIDAVRISFAGNGGSGGRFADATPTKEAADLGAVLDALQQWGAQRFLYAGHSMGGAVGVIRASTDARIERLVSLAGMFHVEAFMARTFGHLVPGEGLMLDKPGCVWNHTLAEDAKHLGSLHAHAAAITVPWLLVHGDADELVPLQDSLDAQAAAGGRPELVTLPGIDHRFTGAVPAMCDAVIAWLDR